MKQNAVLLASRRLPSPEEEKRALTLAERGPILCTLPAQVESQAGFCPHGSTDFNAQKCALDRWIRIESYEAREDCLQYCLVERPTGLTGMVG